MRRSIIKDILAIVVLLVVGFFCKKIFEIVGDNESAVHIGSINLKISIYDVVHYLVYIVVVLLITKRSVAATGKYFFILYKNQIRKRFLLTKIANAIIYLIATLVMLDLLPIDTKIIATVGGAIGIGLGFGLQKIASNFISGVILFAEQSVRVDDIIELEGGIIGVVKQMYPRYTLLETSNGKEIFIPNEDLVIKKVISWTHNSLLYREEFTIKIKHNSDISKVIDIIKTRFKTTIGVSKDKESECVISGYDEYGIILTIKIWVSDIKEYGTRTKAEFLSSIIEDFRANNIKIPIFEPIPFNLTSDSNKTNKI